MEKNTEQLYFETLRDVAHQSDRDCRVHERLENLHKGKLSF